MNKLRVMSIYGLSGVGKTQLALHYANTSLSLYEVVAWILSESQIEMTQALSVLAQKLGLPKANESGDDYQASLKVRDWLNSSGHSFLLIFDNVDKINMLLQVWPASTKGSILITTRSPAVVAKRSNNIMHLEPFAAQLGPEALYALTGFEGADDEDTASAEEICRLLGGLPLAIYWTESDQSQNVSIDLLALLPILRGVSVYLSLSTAQATVQATTTTTGNRPRRQQQQEATATGNRPQAVKHHRSGQRVHP
jgi:predicted ATPase